MANRFWVGGSGTWDTTSTANWSASSGGASGASAPTSSDVAFLNAASGAVTVTLGEDVPALSMDMTGFTGTLAFGSSVIRLSGNASTIFTGTTGCTVTGTPVIECIYVGSTGTRTLNCQAVTEANTISFAIKSGTDAFTFSGNVRNIDYTGFAGTYNVGSTTRRVYGNFKLPAGVSVATGAGLLVFAGTGGSNTIETNGIVIDGDVSFSGVGGSWSLVDDFSAGSSKTFYLANGTFSANNKNVSIGNFALQSGTKTLTLGSGTWTVAGTSWNANSNVTGLTVSASTGTISMTSGSAKTFSGGGKTWPTLNQGGAGALTIAQSNTFGNITNTIQPATITLTAGTTQTVSTFGVSGTSGNLITINSSSSGTRATLSSDFSTISVSYCSIKDISATGSAFWRAYTSDGNVDNGNNSGWDFNSTSWRYVYPRRKNKVIFPF